MTNYITRREYLIATAIGTAASLHAAVTSAEDKPSSRQLLVKRVLFLGNSITIHGPAPEIGWTGHWGMAASCEEKDYVHLLLKEMAANTETPPESMIRNFADFERQLSEYNIAEGLEKEFAFGADLVIIAIGENSSALTNADEKARFGAQYTRLLDEIKKHGSPTIIARSCFWADAAKDQLMREACLTAGVVWVELPNLGSDEKNAAKSERQIEHAGVAGHPGDTGMQAIADHLWTAIREHKPLWKD